MSCIVHSILSDALLESHVCVLLQLSQYSCIITVVLQWLSRSSYTALHAVRCSLDCLCS